MKAAIRRMERGEAVRTASLPDDVLDHLIAARYGATPAQVREWPADEWLLAVKLLGVTGR